MWYLYKPCTLLNESLLMGCWFSLWKSWLSGVLTWKLVASIPERGNSWNRTSNCIANMFKYNARVPAKAVSGLWPRKMLWKGNQSFTRSLTQRCDVAVIPLLRNLTCERPSQSDNAQTAVCEYCGKDFPSVSALKDHLSNSCPEKMVPCVQTENGCTWKGRRASL